MIDVEIYDKEQHYLKLLNMKLREADKQEMLASSGVGVTAGLVGAVAVSDIVCKAYLLNKDKLIAIAGALYSPIKNFAIVWAMGTDDVLEHWEEIEPLFTKHVNAILNVPGIEIMGNVIDLRNTAHIRWIQKLGFTMTGETIMLGGFEFELFYKGKL